MAYAKLESVAQTENAGLFSITFEGESYSEFQKFIDKHKDAYSKDLDIILKAITHMLTVSGFLERYFRPEGKMRDKVCAVPIDTSRLRLFCVRVNDGVLIAGNGGVKKTQRYEDDPELQGYVVTLQKIDKALEMAVKKGKITIERHSIEDYEDLTFSL